MIMRKHLHDWWLAHLFDPNDPANAGVADPAIFDFQDISGTNNAAKTKRRLAHNKIFAYIRSRLSARVFDTTTKLECNVPLLLRHLRAYWNDGSDF